MLSLITLLYGGELVLRDTEGHEMQVPWSWVHHAGTHVDSDGVCSSEFTIMVPLDSFVLKVQGDPVDSAPGEE